MEAFKNVKKRKELRRRAEVFEYISTYHQSVIYPKTNVNMAYSTYTNTIRFQFEMCVFFTWCTF